MWKKVGTGSSSFFWFDPWLEGRPLFKRFQRLFLLSLEKEGKISDVIQPRKEEVVSIGRWRRELFEWEVEKLRDMLQVINSIGMTWEGADKWLWKKDNSGSYTVLSAYKWIQSSDLSAVEEFQKKLWSCGAPLKVKALFGSWSKIGYLQ